MVEKIKMALERAYLERENEVVPKNIPAIPRTTASESETTVPEETALAGARYSLIDTSIFDAQRIITGDDADSNSEKIRLLRSELLYLSKTDHISTFGISSAGEGEGKTTIALNLAISLSRSAEANVILIDGDIKNPQIHNRLGVESDYGLVDLIGGHVPLLDVMLRLSIPNLWLIPGREESSKLLDQAKSARVEELVGGFSIGGQSIVLVDLPPMLNRDDALVLASALDAVLLVVEEGKTTEEEIKRASGLLKQCNYIGNILNRSNNAVVAS